MTAPQLLAIDLGRVYDIDRSALADALDHATAPPDIAAVLAGLADSASRSCPS